MEMMKTKPHGGVCPIRSAVSRKEQSDLSKDRYVRVANELKDQYSVDVLHDILLGRPDRIYLYAKRDTLESMVLQVISGTLQLIGFPDQEQIAFCDILSCFDEHNRYADVSGHAEYRQYVWGELVRKDREPNVTFPIVRGNQRFWLHVLISPVHRCEELVSVFITVVTQTMIAEEQNFDRSHRDSLTGLFNKYTLDYHYGLRYRWPMFHAMYLDLDDFKTLNDHYGHHEGDAFLRSFANILQSHQTDYNLFYRLGGDEFIGLIFGTEEAVCGMARDILERTRRIRFKTAACVPSVSIGIVCSEQGDDVIQKADQVMYEVKHNGKNSYLYRKESAVDR